MSLKTKQNVSYQFGSYRLDAVKRVLLKDGQPVPLTPKAFDTLLVLVRNRGDILPKDDLIKTIWPDSFVEEGNLTVNISMLRKALGESPNQHRYIVTVPGRGYRFVASVQELLGEGADLVVEEHALTRVVIEEETVDTESRRNPLPAILNLARLSLRSRIAAVCMALLAAVAVAVLGWRLWPTPKGQTRVISLSSLQRTQLASWKTEAGAPATIPRFSRDGKMIAFSSTKSGRSNIWIKQVMGGDPIQITRGDWNDLTPVWSPDGQQIAFLSDRGGQDGIWVTPAYGGTPMLLTTVQGASKHLRLWSRDSKTIYYEVDRNLYAFEIESKLASQLTNFDSSKAFSRDFSISADENWIAYTDGIGGQFDIWTLPLRGGVPHQVTNDVEADMYPAWHPDGKRIIYSSSRSNGCQICVAYLDGRKPEQLTSTDDDNISPDVSPDGTRILFHGIKEESDLWGVKTKSGEEFEMTSEVGMEIWPDASPDGKAVVFQSLGGSERLFNSSIEVMPISKGGQEVQLARNAFDPRWSPDGAKVAFLCLSGDLFNLWAINAVGGEAKQLTTEGLMPPSFIQIPLDRVQDGGYSWSPDGSKLAYSSSVSGQSSIWTVSADGSIRDKVSDNAISEMSFTRPLWSPNGDRIASVLAPSYSSGDKSYGWSIWISGSGSIFRYPFWLRLIGWAPSGESVIAASTESEDGFKLADVDLFEVSAGSRLPIAQLKLSYPNNIELSPDGKFVACVSRQDGRDNIWIVSASGGPVTKLTANTDPRTYFSALAWSPDGKTIYYSKQSRSSQVSIIDNFN